MKSLVLLISIEMVSFVLNDSSGGKASKYDDCKNLKLEESTNHCCFAEFEATIDGKEEKGKECVEITQKEYENIKDYVNEILSYGEKKGAKDYSYDIDCSCSYLTKSLLGLIILLI